MQMERVDSFQAAREMGAWRVPWLGATLPWGITTSISKHGLSSRSRWFGTIDVIKAEIDADRPVIVLVRPTDIKRLPFFSLHYRVVVGYNDNENAPGGGELFFCCSALPPVADREANRPGNLTLSYAQFRWQWLTWMSINSYIVSYSNDLPGSSS
jgi:hypothetical protein